MGNGGRTQPSPKAVSDTQDKTPPQEQTQTPPQEQTAGDNASRGFVPGQRMRPIGEILSETAGASGNAPKVQGQTAGDNTPAQQPEPKRMSYEDMFRKLSPYQPPTKEELEKERKKQKRERVFAAINDGISALSNLYFTTRYAPNMYKPAETQSEKTRKRWDKLTAERNANMTAYINGLMRARQTDDDYNGNERAWARLIGLDKAEAERYKAKTEADQANADREYNFRVQAHKDETERNKARDAETIRHNKATEAISRLSATNSASGGGGGRKGGYTREQKQRAWSEWWKYTDEQRKEWRRRFGNRRDQPDSDDFVIAVMEMHDDYIAQKNGGKKSINGFGGKQQGTGKKSIKGFGGN